MIESPWQQGVRPSCNNTSCIEQQGVSPDAIFVDLDDSLHM
jgi:hypothetical protein